MTDKQLNEGIRDVLLTLFSVAATSYEAGYVLDQLEKRPEKPEVIVKALKMADSKDLDPNFDNTVKQLLSHYTKIIPSVLVKPNIIPTPPVKPKPVVGVVTPEGSTQLVNLIKQFEKFSPTPYWDYKQYSIGYGSKAKSETDSVTKEEASQRLLKLVDVFRDKVLKVNNSRNYNWNEAQINALTSFCYNIGNIKGVTANGTRTNDEIASAILKYNKAGGKVKKGLVKRREQEHSLFTGKI
tara:strand:- start:32019 stop:32738 length:720 start_codon:yes stop_codon:yes gene_type:complete